MEAFKPQSQVQGLTRIYPDVTQPGTKSTDE